MKQLFFSLLFLSTVTVTMAQNKAKDDIAIVQEIYGESKKEVITEFMDLEASQAESFWKIYDQYEAERQSLGRKRIELIDAYSESFEGITNEKADEIAKGVLKNNMDYEKLYAKYYKKIKKALSAIDAAKFIQIEAYLQTTIRNAIQEEMPFMGDLQKSKSGK